ncbi:MAG: hypothetical protein J3R72DRAFT_441617 [Linnemannia gamsii]|nr:MAG: hypothetical protein J3R72DRAFT_441617 [Linnemannia gamsii]
MVQKEFMQNVNNHNEYVSMTTTSSSSSSPTTATTNDTGTTITTFSTSEAMAHHYHTKKTFFIEDDQAQEQEQQEQDIDMKVTVTTTMQRNNTNHSSMNKNVDNELAPLYHTTTTTTTTTQSLNNSNSNDNSDSRRINSDDTDDDNKDDNTITFMPLPNPSQRLQQHNPDMQQPAPHHLQAQSPEKIKKRRPSSFTTTSTPSAYLLQHPHMKERRRSYSSSTSWAYGENGTPWSPWSRWRVVLKLLYAVVVPAVIIYLLKNMDERIASRQKHQLHGRSGGSMWRWRKDSTTSPVPGVEYSAGKGSVWCSGRAGAGAGAEEHRCAGGGSGDAVDEPRKSHWLSNGDRQHGNQPSC